MDITIYDTTSMSDADRRIAENAYREAVLAQVPSEALLAKIQADETEALKEGVAYFEGTNSAWSELDRIGCRAAEEALGYWPGPAAHFEVRF